MNNLPQSGQHTGFQEVLPQPSDWMSGGETGIQGAALNTEEDWREYASPGKWQRDMKTLFETDACVSFGAIDDLQAYVNFCLRNSLWDAEHMTWLAANGYLDETGHANFSPRFIAKLSGTTMLKGNSFPAVWQAVRTYGLVPESAWPSDFKGLIPAPEVSGETQENWNIYYAEIPEDVLALGKEFRSRFELNWEWVSYPGVNMDIKGFASQLSRSPLEITTAICMPWNTTQTIQGCGAGSEHATALLRADELDGYSIRDHYSPFDKTLAPNYVITYATRGILTPISSTPDPIPFHHTFNVGIPYGSPASPEVSCLQTALQTLKTASGVPYMHPGVFGPFGPQTKAALALFQKEHNIQDDGTHFGPQTRAALNAALNS